MARKEQSSLLDQEEKFLVLSRQIIQMVVMRGSLKAKLTSQTAKLDYYPGIITHV
uniref:Uncharacterized protein n=1 Tax=Solanum tuberosum TaxID=4113 RepID=M1CCN6_SOLTU